MHTSIDLVYLLLNQDYMKKATIQLPLSENKDKESW